MIGVGSIILLLASIAAAQKPVPVNDLVDKQMAAHNAILTRYGLGLSDIAAGSANGVEFSKGIQVGGNTLKRTGDSYAIKKGDGVTSYQYKVGYDILLFAFGKITVDGKPMSGYFRVNDNTMMFDFTVINGTSCKVTMDEYKFIKFDDITYETSEPLSANKDDLPSSFKETLLAHVNARIEEKKPSVERHLQAMCQPNSFPKGGKPSITGPSLAVTEKPPHVH